MNPIKNTIGWADYSFNPVCGCKRDCKKLYGFDCYAKKMNGRFKWIPEWTELKFFPERLEQPSKIKKPSKIFVGSMSDICFWNPSWIEATVETCENNPQHTFMFLTKEPKIYQDFKWSKNCWLGVTITGLEGYRKEWEMLAQVESNPNKTFVSYEPLLGEITYGTHTDLVIVGAETGPNAIKPDINWIKSIVHKNIYYKNNIRKYLK